MHLCHPSVKKKKKKKHLKSLRFEVFCKHLLWLNFEKSIKQNGCNSFLFLYRFILKKKIEYSTNDNDGQLQQRYSCLH